jgi:hypothetical protein
MAGVMALVNQKFGRQGQADFTLYALARQQPNVFHDIAMGTNDTLCLPQAPGCTASLPNLPSLIMSWGVYAATTGYDQASGLGSLDVNSLIANWNQIAFLPTNTSLQLNPSSVVHGAPISITANVKAETGSVVPSGDVSISTTYPLPLIGTNEIPLAGGAASSQWSFFPGGTYAVNARYAGDGTFAVSSSTPVSLTVSPEPSTTALSLHYSYIDPTSTPRSTKRGIFVSGGNAPFGSVWNFQAQPTGQSSQTSGNATGSATFTDGTTSATGPLNAQGMAVWMPEVLTIGRTP